MGNQAANRRKIRYIVSACLIGLKTRYDSTDKLSAKVRELVEKGIAVPFCPEQGGGLPTPRVPSEIMGGGGADVLTGNAMVISRYGGDVTKEFIKGAQDMLELARLFGASKAILKSYSPSCGFGIIYDGTFTGNTVDGDGVAAALLKEAGLEILTEKEFE